MQALVVEDEPLAALDFAEALRRLGAARVDVAHDGERALALAEARVPDLALVDLNLDGPLDGLTVGEELAGMGVAVIYATGSVDRAILYGRSHAADVLRKPISERDLAQSLARLQDRRRVQVG